MGASPYDIGIPMDVEEHLRKLAEILGCNVTDIAHALMRDSLNRITHGQSEMSKDDYCAAAKSWQRTMGLPTKKV